MSESFLNGRITLHAGDSRDVLKTIPDCSIDSIVTDPPYALVSIVKRFGGKNAAGVKVPEGGSGAYARASSGFMGKTWDTGETAFAVEFWAECLRVLKPGGHVVAFSGTRTYHRMACAIEDCGFEIRDALFWHYASGFPKSHDVSKGIDRAAGATREVVGKKQAGMGSGKSFGMLQAEGENASASHVVDVTAPATAAAAAAAAAWSGWGTALKPATEPICLARKPLSEKTVAANVLKFGTGAINIDSCRIEFSGTNDAAAASATAAGFAASRSRGALQPSNSIGKESRDGTNNYNPFELAGRWPANLLHDGSSDAVAPFPIDSEIGSAARFFYTAKADADDRLGSKHPTVKPVDLMQWLCRLVTPPGGTVLDPFAGTGTTGDAAFREGFNAVLIEREAEYQADIRRRMGLVLSGPDERSRESIKARTAGQQIDAGPLFGGLDTPPRRAGESTEYSRTNNRTDRIEVVNE